jgi:hypothetical protein
VLGHNGYQRLTALTAGANSSARRRFWPSLNGGALHEHLCVAQVPTVGVQVPLGYNDQRNQVIVRGEYQPVAGLFSGIRLRRAHGERRAGLADIAATLTTADVGAGWPGFPRSGTAVGEWYRVPAQRAMALAVDRVTRPRAQRGFMVSRQRESGVSVRVRRGRYMAVGDRLGEREPLGTMRGPIVDHAPHPQPHDLHASARQARTRTWGSRGRRFESGQPDQGSFRRSEIYSPETIFC